MSRRFRAVALVAAYNEEDVIAVAIEDLVRQGLEVWLLDDGSTDATAAEARRFLGRGLLAVEPLEAPPGPRRFSLARILRRKEALAREIDADWFVNHDADEFRSPPWPGEGLARALERVDRLGFDAVDFSLFDFRPTGESFARGQDPREVFRWWQPARSFDRRQVRAWKGGRPVRLEPSGGHDAEFPGRRVFPIRFLLRHYPLRGAAHAARKVERERLARFDPEEVARGWHRQYREGELAPGYVWDRRGLEEWDEAGARLLCLAAPRGEEELRERALRAEAAAATLAAERDEWLARAGSAGREAARLAGELEAAREECERLRRALAAAGNEAARLARELRRRDLDLRALRARLDPAAREPMAPARPA